MVDFNSLESKIKSYNDKFGFDFMSIEQGSDAWKKARAGVITASKAKDFLAKPGTLARQSLISSLVAQIAAGYPEEIPTAFTDWGIRHEPIAREMYSFEIGIDVREYSFIYKDESMRFGCSPDGITKNGGVEIKCPHNTKYHVEFLSFGKIKPEYMHQCQFSMWVTGFDSWDFVSFDPRMKTNNVHYKTIERDEKQMKRFDETAESFIKEMDEMLDKLGIEFGDQWKS